jgi:hypothetical protein
MALAVDEDTLQRLFEEDLDGHPDALRQAWCEAVPATVYAAYNVATRYASHAMRSAAAADVTCRPCLPCR